MGRLYTLDGKYLTDTPEVRIGEKIYPVDDRTKTVKKILKMQNEREKDSVEMDLIDEVIKLAVGEKAYKEINLDEMPFPACQEIFVLIMSAITGEEPESADSRFQKEK